MSNELLASGVANTKVKHFSQIAKSFITDIDYSPIAIYLVDICDEACLSVLAEQFGVGGKCGFDYCTTVSQQRSLIKKAISIQKYMGTIYAIRECCELLGFTFKRIDKGIDDIWCKFNVILSGTESDTTGLRYLLERYKSARDILNEINFES